MKDIVLILSYQKDHSLHEILAGLKHHDVRVVRLDTGDFPSSITIDSTFSTKEAHWRGTFFYEGHKYHLEDIRCILSRRPTHYRVDATLPPQVQRFAELEAEKGFGGLLRSLNCVWVSPPEKIRRANFKPVQLQLAQSIGFTIPASLITNDPDALLHFYHEHNRHIIIKTLHGGNVGVDAEQWDAIYTSRVTPEALEQRERIRLTAHFFQSHIEKAFEVRITVVGNQIFTAKVHSQHAEASRVDFRAGYQHVRYEPFELPDTIREQCLAITHHLGLLYCTIDMAVQPDGTYVFFEVNPVGQFQWIEVATGLPIGQAIADLCVEGI